jgi:hypothetical protein
LPVEIGEGAEFASKVGLHLADGGGILKRCLVIAAGAILLTTAGFEGFEGVADEFC